MIRLTNLNEGSTVFESEYQKMLRTVSTYQAKQKKNLKQLYSVGSAVQVVGWNDQKFNGTIKSLRVQFGGKLGLWPRVLIDLGREVVQVKTLVSVDNKKVNVSHWPQNQ